MAESRWDLCFNDLLFPENAGDGLGSFSPLRQPVQRPLPINVDLGWIDNRVILSDYFEKPAISGSALLDHYDPIIGTLLGPDTGQSNCYQTVSLLLEKKPDKYMRLKAN